MCALLLKNLAVATLRQKIGIARNAKKPAWSQAFLAERMHDRLKDHEGYGDKDLKYWQSRVKDIESRRDPSAFEVAVISELLGTEYDWQSSEDDLPVRWRSTYDQAGKQAKGLVIREKREVPYWGYVPSYGWSKPTGDTEKVPTTYEGDDASELKAHRVRLDRNEPRFQPGTLILFKPHPVYTEGLYNLALSAEGEKQLGKVQKDGDRQIMHFANPRYQPIDVTDWECLGFAKHAEETKEEGLS